MDDAELSEAYAARQAGNPTRAVEICRRIIAAEPNHHGARSLLAVCFVEAGEVDRARPLIEAAVATEPDNWRFLLNLSVLREAQGMMVEATQAARQAATNAPGRFEAWGRLGDLCGRQGNFADAAAALEKAVALKPAHPGLALLLAVSAFESGRFDLAGRALEAVPDAHPEALKLRAHLARKQGDPDAFLSAAQRWLDAEPRSEEARVAVAHGLAQRDDFHAAVEVYRPLVEGDPQDSDHAATFAQYLLWSREFEDAERFYRRALDINPDHPRASAGLARLMIYRGRFADAADLARQAIVADPANVDGFGQLALANDMRLSEEDTELLQRVAEDAAIEPDQRAIAWFTAGDVFHKRREHDRAFEAWRRANSLKRGVSPAYDRAATEMLVERLIASFDAGLDASPNGADPGPQPVFIVGMPRSGTTLLDAALAAHPDVSSGGELPAMPSLLTRFLAWADGAGWQGGEIPASIAAQLRAAYLRQYETYHVAPARFVTDKQPLNYLSVGLIRRLFPDAPVIHIHRDPIETGFSIFRNNFTKSWPFTTSLRDIGHYYGQYARLMAHWDGVLGNRIASVEYEDLVENFEGELRRILAYVGLPWDPACLSYHEQESIVTTLSSAQVRQAPSKALMRSAEPYRRALQPLREALEQGGVTV